MLEQGDACDPVALSRALVGCDAVISALGPRKISLFRRVTLLSEATRALVSVMDRQQPPRLVRVTDLGAGDSAGHCGFAYDRLIKPLLLRTIYEDKDRQAAIIKDSLVDSAVVGPTVLTDKPATGQIRAITDLEGFHGGQISRSDVATFVVAQASGNEWLRQTPLITQQTGPNHQRQRPVGDTARTRRSA